MLKKLIAALLAVLMVPAAGAVAQPVEEPAPLSVECRVVAAEEAYRLAANSYDKAHRLFGETGYRRHREARREAVAALEQAAETRWRAWQAWRQADGDVAAVSHRRYQAVLDEGDCG